MPPCRLSQLLPASFFLSLLYMNIMMSPDIFLQVQKKKKKAEKGNPVQKEMKPVMQCYVLLRLLSLGLTGARL